MKGLDFPAHHKEDDEKLEKNNMEIDWKKFEQNNKTIALNILFVLQQQEDLHTNQNITISIKIK